MIFPIGISRGKIPPSPLVLHFDPAKWRFSKVIHFDEFTVDGRRADDAGVSGGSTRVDLQWDRQAGRPGNWSNAEAMRPADSHL
jgi:hypothetical protein